MDPDRRVQTRGRIPGLEANARDVTAARTSRVQRYAHTVARDDMPLEDDPVDLHLEALDRRVDVARRSGRRDLLTQHRPRFNRVAQLKGDVVDVDLTDARETELEERRQPRDVEVESVTVEVTHDLCDVGRGVERE